ncbi:STAS domain-containing protein [Nonomuraea spiralis]|uniref:STAS domain-containing protein n=1 Tax=Nonomuraea spiralis TaxID=46182 RepID=UPI0037B6F7F7
MNGIDDESHETSWRGPRLRAETRQVDGCLVMGLSGELDFTQKPEFRRWALEVVAGEGGTENGHENGHGGGTAARMVVLDLGGIEFFDSSGLAVVIALWKQAREAGNDLAVAGPPPVCASMMRRTGMADHIAMSDTVDAALAGAARGTGRVAGQAEAG